MRHRGQLVFVVLGVVLAANCGGESATYFNVVGGSAGSVTGGSDASGGTPGSSGGSTSGDAGTGEAGSPGGGAISGSAGAAGEPGVGGEAGAATTGTLQVVVGGTPSGEVVITGPDYSSTITSTTTLALTEGSYSVVAKPARVDGDLIDTLHDATVLGSPANVTAGGFASVTVSYSAQKRTGTGLLWASNDTGMDVLGFTANHLASAGSDTGAANVVLSMPTAGTGGASPRGIAFDSTGYLWVGYCRGAGNNPQAVLGFAPNKLSANQSPSADITINTPGAVQYDCVNALTFDADDNLYVGFIDGYVLRYSAADLVASGTPAPTLTTWYDYYGEIQHLMVDKDGNIWVTAYSSNRVSRIDASQLDTVSYTAPAMSWSAGSAINGPCGIAMGPDGKVWVSNFDGNTLTAMEASQFSIENGPPTAAITISSADLDGPEQIAFDEAGNLWVASWQGDRLLRFDADDLTTSGTKSPAATFSGGGSVKAPYGLWINPPPILQ